jgi:hypothetical protein
MNLCRTLVTLSSAPTHRCSGNEVVVRANDVHDLCYEVDDAGGFYVGRSWASVGNVSALWWTVTGCARRAFCIMCAVGLGVHTWHIIRAVCGARSGNSAGWPLFRVWEKPLVPRHEALPSLEMFPYLL